VHIAPAFGEDDFNVAKARRPSTRCSSVKPDGCFDDHVPLVGGLFFTDANAIILKALESRACCTNARCTNTATLFVGAGCAAYVLCAKGVVYSHESMREVLVRNNEMSSGIRKRLSTDVALETSSKMHAHLGAKLGNANWGTPLPYGNAATIT